MQAYDHPHWVPCPPRAHTTRKRGNCKGNPNCLFGMGVRTKEAGIWNKDLVTNVLGRDPADTLKRVVINVGDRRCGGGGDGDGAGEDAKGKKRGNGKKGKKGDAAANGVPAPGKTGLQNLGATCYINCLLQTLFHNPRFRRAIYEWRRPHKVALPTNVSPAVIRQLDILEAMQLLFGRMDLTALRFVLRDLTSGSLGEIVRVVVVGASRVDTMS